MFLLVIEYIRVSRPPKCIRGMLEMNYLFLSGDFNFKLAQKCSFDAVEVLPEARIAKLHPMYPLPEGVTEH